MLYKNKVFSDIFQNDKNDGLNDPILKLKRGEGTFKSPDEEAEGLLSIADVINAEPEFVSQNWFSVAPPHDDSNGDLNDT